MTNKLRNVGALLLGIWLLGAAVTALLDEMKRKSDCIDQEGLLKGLFWCSTDSWERDGGHLEGLINGLRWPFTLMTPDKDKAGLSEVTSPKNMSQEEIDVFNKSELGRAYKCYAIAKHAGLKEQASNIENTIIDWRKANSISESRHNELSFHAIEVAGDIDVKAHGDLSSYFDYVCREPTVATVYKCYLAAVRAGLKDEASTISRTISSMRQESDFSDQKHKMYMLYSAPEMERIENTEGVDFSSFFEFVCREGVQNMKQMLDDGMLQ